MMCPMEASFAGAVWVTRLASSNTIRVLLI